MENLANGAAGTPPHESADLSVEISRIVARRMRGEEVDTTSSGRALAARFPEMGLSADMIAQAIERAAGMVDLIRDGAVTSPEPAAAEPAKAADLLTSDAALAAAIEAELSELVGGPIERRQADGDASEADAGNANADDNAEPAKAEAPPAEADDQGDPRSRGLLGRVVRRAFSRG